MVDVVVVGSGPNGLAAAITCAAAGRSVVVLEGADTIGGGTRSAELTLPGFVHDVCSAVHPLAAVSPFFQAADLARHGLELVHPEVALVHPLDDGRAGVLHRSLDRTAEGLGVDGRSWQRHVGLGRRSVGCHRPVDPRPAAAGAAPPADHGRVRAAGRPPGHRGRPCLRHRRGPWHSSPAAAAHSFLPLSRPFTSAMGLMLLASAHVAGWPSARGGSQAIADAMAKRLAELGGTIETGRPVRSLDDLPDARAVLFDVTPRQLVRICGDALPDGYRRRLGRLPLRARRLQDRLRACPSRCRGRTPTPDRAGCLHLGGHPAGGRHRRGRRGRRPPPRPAVHPRGAAEPVRPRPGTGRASTRSGRTATCPPARRST